MAANGNGGGGDNVIVEGVAAVAAAAAAATAVGLLPQPSFEQSLKLGFLSFLCQMMARVCGGGGPFHSYRAQDGQKGKGPT